MSNGCVLKVMLDGQEFLISCRDCPNRGNKDIDCVSMGAAWTNASLEKAIRDLGCCIGPRPFAGTHDGATWTLTPRSD